MVFTAQEWHFEAVFLGSTRYFDVSRLKEYHYIAVDRTKYMWPDLQNPNNSAFFKFHNYNLLSQMYILAKFQPDMLIIFRVMALQSSNSKMIDVYSKHWENKLQALTKMLITYK